MQLHPAARIDEASRQRTCGNLLRASVAAHRQVEWRGCEQIRQHGKQSGDSGGWAVYVGLTWLVPHLRLDPHLGTLGAQIHSDPLPLIGGG